MNPLSLQTLNEGAEEGEEDDDKLLFNKMLKDAQSDGDVVQCRMRQMEDYVKIELGWTQQ